MGWDHLGRGMCCNLRDPKGLRRNGSGVICEEEQHNENTGGPTEAQAQALI
jgi:hypothetical protein